MVKLLRKFVSALPLVCILLIFFSISGALFSRSQVQATRLEPTHVATIPHSAVPPATDPTLMRERFMPVMENVANAQACLINVASSEAADLQQLRCAGESYRNAMRDLRSAIADHEREYGSNHMHQALGMMLMQKTMSINQRAMKSQLQHAEGTHTWNSP